MIDAHVHVWDPAVGFGWLRGPLRRSFSLEDLQGEWERSRITGVSVILVEAGRGDDDETESLLRLAEQTPYVAGVVGAMRLRDGDALDRLHTVGASQWLCGIRERLDGKGLPDAVADVGGFLSDHRLVLELNVAAGRLRDVAEVCAAAGPEVPVVLDHVGTPPGSLTDPRGRQWAADLAEVARLQQVRVKLSGLGTQLGLLNPDERSELMRYAVDQFGPERVMLGSDWPVCTLAGDWKHAVESAVAACPPEALEWITRATAARTYLEPR